MKNRFKVLFLTFTTLMIFGGIACQPSSEEQAKPEHTVDEGLPLIYQMSFMQRYATKLYFSGMEENWGLADIYAHEMEEIAEVIIEEGHVDDGINISNLMETMFPPALEQVEQAIDAGDKKLFEERYQTMVETCNSCHTSSDYGLVKISVPGENPFAQDFSKPANK